MWRCEVPLLLSATHGSADGETVQESALRDLSFIMFLSIYSMMGKSIIVVSCVSWRPDKSEAKQKDKTCFAFEKVIQGEKSCPRYIGGKVFVGEIKRLSPIRKGNLKIPRLR